MRIIGGNIRGRGRLTVGAKAIRLLGALQLGLTSLATAQGGVARYVPDRPAGYVTDLAGVIDSDAVRAMTDKIERLRNTTGAEIAVVTLPTIGDYEAAEVAVAIGRAWGVGAKAEVGDKRRNAGLVILLVPRREDDPNSGQVFIATGNGLEGIVTDATAGRVRDLMRPSFGEGRYGEGLREGVDALSAIIALGMGVTDSALTAGGQAIERGPESDGYLPLVIFFVIFFLVLMASLQQERQRVLPGRRGRRGPNIFVGGPGWGGGFGGHGGGMGGGGFGGFGGGGGFSGGGAGGRF